tara:strand:- start:4310 stop:5329 length:1020 start_codon:yes stop_codon:yes gene_type:complete
MPQQPLITPPSIGDDNEQCANQIALAQGNEATRGTDMITAIVSGQGLKTLDEITGGKIPELSNAINLLLNENETTLSKIRSSRLYNDWLNSNKLIDVAKIKSIVAARKYYVSLDGNDPNQSTTDTSFNLLYLNPIVREDLSGIETEINNYINDISNNFSDIINIYNDVSNSGTEINILLENKQQNLFDIVENIQFYETKYNVDVRKNLYDYERTTLYNSIYNVIKLLYYGLLIVYIIFGDFMKNKMYKNKTFYIVAIIYLIIPYILKYIYAAIIFIYEYIVNFFTGGKPILTYSDIVRANNIENIYTAPVPSLLNQKNLISGYKQFVGNPININLPFLS